MFHGGTPGLGLLLFTAVLFLEVNLNGVAGFVKGVWAPIFLGTDFNI
jgi:hypothetical protein